MLIVHRTYHDNCTTSDVTYGDFKCKGLELPRFDNKPNVSCIPEGIYHCHKITSPSLGKCFEIENVPSRTYIRGHVGNFTSEIRGCILFGDRLLDFNNDGITDVTNSKKTFGELMELLPDEFMMEIA